MNCSKKAKAEAEAEAKEGKREWILNLLNCL